MTRVVSIFLLALAAVACTGCASPAKNPVDPFENFNRAMFTFNDKVDETALKPTAELYQKVAPDFVQTGVGNFFGNIGDVWTAVNELLQGKVEYGLNDFMRVIVNTTFGLGGVIDIASEAGMPRHKEDFGQTLGRWGMGSGPYVMLPVLGPSTLRDTAALPVDMKADLWNFVDPVRTRNVGTVVRVIDQRAALLDASDLLEAAALDRYEFIRDGFLQRRDGAVHDGDNDKNINSGPDAE
jgi:phospholipid-binding lipoprotein MlaA